MAEEKKMDWLDGQTMTIPIEEFIKIKIEMAEQIQKEDNLYHRIWETEGKLKDTQEALEDAKRQIRELLGVEDPNRLAEMQFERGVKTE